MTMQEHAEANPLRLERWPIDRLVPSPRNARTHSVANGNGTASWSSSCRTPSCCSPSIRGSRGILRSYSEWLEATEAMQKYGTLIKSPNGYPVQSPYVSIANQ
jgi:transcription elongation factor